MYKHDRLLSQELCRVAAPEELWERIQCPKIERTRGLGTRLGWALAASVPVVAMVWFLQPQQAIPLPAKPSPAVQTVATPWDHQMACTMCHT